MKRIIKLMTILITFIVFCNKVFANDYDISLTTNQKGDLKPGDIIEVNAGIGALVDDWTINKQEFLFIYDKDVFELVFEKSANGFSEPAYKVREGWESGNFGFSLGRFSITVNALSDDYNIMPKDASNNILDDINATLITVKLKVKDVSNQDTKVQLVNELDYVDELNFSIYSKSTNNFLSLIEVEGYELSEAFNKNKTSYDVYVPYDTSKITIMASLEDKTATLKGIGEKEINVGDNKVELLVTAEDGSKKIYTLNVIRKSANEDTSLSKVIVNNSNKEKIPLVYDDKTKTYTGNVPSDITFVYFDIKCSGEGCYNDELEPTTLIEGKNEFKFLVTSQNGNEEIYKIIINKENLPKDNTVLFLIISLVILFISSIIFLVLYLKNRKK